MRTMKLNQTFSASQLSSTGIYSFLNFASIEHYIKNQPFDDINYFCDGILSAAFFTLITRKKIQRVSFDFTSIAEPVFSHASSHKNKIYFLGAEQHEINTFINKIKKKIPNLPISGYSSGYFDEQNEEKIIEHIIQSDTKIAIIGLGAGKQEDFLLKLKSTGYSGIAFTCGGFIRQEANTTDRSYYPKLVNSLHLRSLYRMYREPHTISRYFIDYPRNLIKIIKLIASSKIKVATYTT
ncbi:UDP-Gal:alpha-D-GlcNAc-diphosphoundecaprenol beta-1,4-galactosyltransferase [compost metagenome]